MKDEIREAFEKSWIRRTEGLRYWTSLERSEALDGFREGWQACYNYRHEEIQRLKKIIECKDILLIAYRTGNRSRVDRALSRLKALKDGK